MPGPAPAYRTRPPVVRKAAVDGAAMSVSALLTYPLFDLAGDYVEPAGCDFGRHARDPWVDIEHTGTRVGWARKSLSARGGPYGVSWATVDVDGSPHRLPFGTTWFDPSDRLSAQVFDLVARDALPGVSLEFYPVPGFAKSLGRSPLEPRDAYRFDRADVVRWTHCATPVNSGALTVTKSAGQVPPPLLTILSSGRVGSEPLHPAVRKALAHHLPHPRLVRVEKAMNDTVYDEAAPESAPEEVAPGADDGGEATPTAQAAYDAAQMLADACGQIRDALAKSEHVAGKKKLLALCAAIDKLAEKATATGDMVAADVGGDGGMDEDDEEPPVEPDATEPDDEDGGVLKAFRAPHRRKYRKAVKRFSAAEVAAAMSGEAARDPDAAEADALRARLAKTLKQTVRILTRA